MTATATETPAHQVGLTDTAREKVRSLLEQEGRDDLRLRIAVQPGGCSGLIYQLYFDDRVLDGDAVRDFDGVEVVVDRMSVALCLLASTAVNISSCATRKLMCPRPLSAS